MKYIVDMPDDLTTEYGGPLTVALEITAALKATFGPGINVTAVDPVSDLPAGLDGAAVTL